MNKSKQTLYEILEISPHASYSEIQAAHQRITQKLRAEINNENRGAVEFKLRVLNVTAKTLSNEKSREEYDARLVLGEPIVVPVPQSSALALMPKDNPATMKSDAMLLKADAMSLRADAVSLRADAASLKSEGRQKSPLKMILTVIAALLATGLVMQVGFSLMALRSAGGAVISASETAKAEEKVYLQNYYQETGVRVNSRAEAELLDAANRRRENAQREDELAKRQQEEDARRFAEESRRIGEEVTANLQRADVQARYEEERQRQREEEKKQAREEMERSRVEEENRQTMEARRRLGLN